MKTHAEPKTQPPSRTPTTPVPNALTHQAQLRNALLRAGVQPRLEIGAVNDPLEREADAAAERVMRMPAQAAQTNLTQTKASPTSTTQPSPQLESSLNSLNSGGRPLDATTRAFFEPRFGQDFSQIPVHAVTPMALQLQPSSRKGDEEPNLASVTQEVPAPPQIAPTELALAPEKTVSGTIPDITTPPGGGRQTGEEEFTEDKPTPGGVGNVVADIHLNFSQPKTDRRSGGKHDAVVSGVEKGAFNQPGGRTVSPFGQEFYEPDFTGISHTFASGKCTISAKLDVKCPWGTAAGNRTDVPSATDAVVTKANWPTIKADLQPSATSPFKSQRTEYYSKSLVEQHEKFHGTDDNDWTSSSGLGIVKANLEAGTVAPANADDNVNTLLDGARTKLISENFKWYKGGGTDHDSYAGEIRAYADGKAAYQQLANDVEKHGKSLP